MAEGRGRKTMLSLLAVSSALGLGTKMMLLGLSDLRRPTAAALSGLQFLLSPHICAPPPVLYDQYVHVIEMIFRKMTDDVVWGN